VAGSEGTAAVARTDVKRIDGAEEVVVLWMMVIVDGGGVMIDVTGVPTRTVCDVAAVHGQHYAGADHARVRVRGF